MRTSSAPFVLALLAAALLGCEKAEDTKGVYWNGTSRPTVQPAAQPTSSSASSSSSATATSSSSSSSSSSSASQSSSNGGAAAGDSVPFSSLRWSYGGVHASGASPSAVTISGLSCSKNGLSFHYVRNLSAWGLSNSNAHALACLFVQKSDGSWVGGKFDWISSSRTTRDFKNINGGYNGWNLRGVPNPCKVAFVIVDGSCGRRSNVISGTWRR